MTNDERAGALRETRRGMLVRSGAVLSYAALAACNANNAGVTAAGTQRTTLTSKSVEMTWFSIANWYFKIGTMNFLMDGYITRVPQNLFYGGGGGLAFTTAAYPVDKAGVTRVRDAFASQGTINYLLAGHSHFDHTYDIATWASLTGAPIIGGISTSLQVQASGISPSQVRVVKGGERIDFGNGVSMYVVRFNHSGNHATNPEQHDPVELHAPPVPDKTNGGFHAGVAEDFPNGGGGRAFLFKIVNPDRTLSFFVQNSASPDDLTQPVVVDGVNYGAPLANLQAAMQNAGLANVDVWVGTTQAGLAQLIVPVIKPRYFLPSHWDGLFAPFFAGIPFPFSAASLVSYLSSQGVQTIPQTQYFDTFSLDTNGSVRKITNSFKSVLGFSERQEFSPEVHELAQRVDMALAPGCCG